MTKELPERSEEIMTAVDVFKEEGRKEGRKAERVYMLVDMLGITKSIALS